MSYDCDVKRIQNLPSSDVRKELLGVHGVGNETADSILLYAFHFPTFVVDVYTMRLFKRYPLDAGKTYVQVKKFIESRIPADVIVYNRFHALIIQNGKEHCKKKALFAQCAMHTESSTTSRKRESGSSGLAFSLNTHKCASMGLDQFPQTDKMDIRTN